MIDWYGVFHNALWVLGLAIALASLSYSDWRRRTSEPRVGLRAALGQPGFQALFSLGMVLFCVGLRAGRRFLVADGGLGDSGAGVCLAGVCVVAQIASSVGR